MNGLASWMHFAARSVEVICRDLAVEGVSILD